MYQPPSNKSEKLTLTQFVPALSRILLWPAPVYFSPGRWLPWWKWEVLLLSLLSPFRFASSPSDLNLAPGSGCRYPPAKYCRARYLSFALHKTYGMHTEGLDKKNEK